MLDLPVDLIPKSREKEKDYPKRIFGYALLRPRLLISTHRMKLPPLDSLKSGNHVLPIMNIREALSTKYGRHLAACTPVLDRICGVIGLYSNRTLPYFFGGMERNGHLLTRLREDLGLLDDAEPMWWYVFADFDVQEKMKPKLT